VIATKVGMSSELPGLSAETIRRGVEGSLERLGVERIDLYYAHQDDPETPLEETLGAFQSLIEEGRIGHAGASNYEAPRLEEALRLGGEREDLASYVALQPHYNLMERDYESELAEVCRGHGLACVPYFGLARGFLTGKYREGTGKYREGAGERVESPRAAGVRESYSGKRGAAVLDALEAVATAHGTSLAAVALAWLRSQSTVVAPIASATSVQQLSELLPSATLELSAGELADLDGASR
jgi:aryl-alcohol dehydrogenase-like predicted oxidoreductase